MTFPEFSVNRTKPDGQPEDVLVPDPDKPEDLYVDWGVASFPPSAVPSTYKGCVLRVEHVPEEHNYYHSEVRSYGEGGLTRMEPSRTVRREIRALIWKASTQRIAPRLR